MASPESKSRKVFNLDQIERERPIDGKERVPFVLVVGDREIVMTDPQELSWQQLMDIEKPVNFFRYCVSDEDRDFIKKLPIPGWKFNELLEQFMDHYGLTNQGNGGASRI